MRVGCVVLAAGRSARLGGADKLLAPLDGRPVLAHSLAAIAACAELTDVVVVTSASNRAAVARVARACGGGKVRALVTGGAERQDSVAAGLAALPNVEIVAIHDGARPLVVAEDFAAGVRAAQSAGAAVAGAPMVDTVKRVDANERVVETPTRSELRAIATPQVFRRELLARAHAAACAAGVSATDDGALVERLGEPVVVFPTRLRNLKITTADDLLIAESLLGVAAETLRTGIGIDSHRFAAGRRLVLGGVEIPACDGLDGHSDADALTHAIIDALLGAAGLGDIGQHFAPQDPEWAGADSVGLLGRVLAMMSEVGARPHGVDATVIAERPRLRPHIDAMRERLAEALGLTTAQVNVKATTAEGMGALGRAEGIQAHAVATVRVTLRHGPIAAYGGSSGADG